MYVCHYLRLLQNGKFEAPLFLIHKHVVQQVWMYVCMYACIRIAVMLTIIWMCVPYYLCTRGSSMLYVCTRCSSMHYPVLNICINAYIHIFSPSYHSTLPRWAHREIYRHNKSSHAVDCAYLYGVGSAFVYNHILPCKGKNYIITLKCSSWLYI